MSDHELWNEVGNLYFKSGAYELAKNAYVRAIALDPEFGKPYANMGVANARQEKFADAIALYRKALELLDDPFDKAFTWYKLGNAYWDVEDYSLAIEAFHKADELLPIRNRDLVASPDMLLTSRRGVNEVLTILDLPEGDVPAVEPTAFIPSASDFGRDAYLDDLSPWKFNESILTDEEPACPEFEWIPLDEIEHIQPSEAVSAIKPTEGEVPAEVEIRDDPAAVEIEFVETNSVEKNIDLPERFVQEFALRHPIAAEAGESELIVPEIEIAILADDEAKAIPFTVAVEEPAIVNAEEPREANLESHLSETEPAEDRPVEAVASVAETLVAAEVSEVVDDITAIEMEHETVNVVESESGAREVNDAMMNVSISVLAVETNEGEATAEFGEPVSMEIEAPPLFNFEPESEIVTQVPNFVSADVTDPEQIQRGAATADSSMDDSIAVWKEINRVKHVLEINPQNSRAWDSLGGLYQTLGQSQQAIDAFQEAVSLDPTKAIYIQRLALAYAADGRLEEAATTFEKAIELNPENSLAHATLGAYYRRQGRDDLANAHIERARELLDGEENEYNRACLEAICGNSDRALGLLEIALKNKQTYATWVRRDPDLDFIRSDSRFTALLAEYEMSETG
jgi:tetratricopeptide (TPR) repeat protein